jgi:hypothetical protein
MAAATGMVLSAGAERLAERSTALALKRHEAGSTSGTDL